jgi:hypothetical protein
MVPCPLRTGNAAPEDFPTLEDVLGTLVERELTGGSPDCLQAGTYRLIEMSPACSRVFATS